MSRFAIRSNLAALALVAATGGLAASTVMAAPPPPMDGGMAAMHEGHRGAGFHKGMQDGLRIPGLGPISQAQLAELKLDAKQEALFKTAQEGQRNMHQAMRDAGVKRHEMLKAQLDSGKLDPRAIMDQSDKARDQFGPQAKQARDQWLAVWDSLNETQRGQVTKFVKERQDRMAERHMTMEGRHGGKGGMMRPAPAN